MNYSLIRAFGSNLTSKGFRVKVSNQITATNACPCLTFKNELTSSRYCSTTSATVTSNPEEGLIKKMIKKFGWLDNSHSRLKVTGYLLYESVADNIPYEQFFKEANMPDTFNSWFLVTELHVWMLLVRSMAEGDEKDGDGRFLRNSVVEALWADVATRTKKLGAPNPSAMRAQIQELSQQFQAALIAYDEGLGNRDYVLAGALWRRYYQMQCDDVEPLENLVRYIRKQIKMLDDIPRDKFTINPEISWTPLREDTK